MLSDREKEGCRTILNKLSQHDLVTLTDTVTNRIVSPESTKGTNYYTTCKVMVNKFNPLWTKFIFRIFVNFQQVLVKVTYLQNHLTDLDYFFKELLLRKLSYFNT